MKTDNNDTTAKTLHILIVEDDRSMRKGLVLELGDRGFEVSEADSFESGRQALQENAGAFDLMITDLRLPEKDDGIRLVQLLKELSPETPALVITAFGSIEAAVKAMQAGAEDFVTKGFTIDELLLKIQKTLDKIAIVREKERLNSENISLKSELKKLLPQWELVGTGHKMNQLRSTIFDYSQTDFTILIEGETGTGKELVARALHRAGPRRRNPFIVINCSAIPKDLLESELFGYEKGAFTGATTKKTGQFEAAHGGVLFLDEIGDLDYGLQAKVLRAIEYKEFTRIGGTKPMQIDVQIIAATNRNILQEVKKHTFREDLYYRLSVMIITVPPLREHIEDIPELTEHFTRLYQKETGQKPIVENETIQAMMHHNWPGNIRELKNRIFRAASMAGSNPINAADFGIQFDPDGGTAYVEKLIDRNMKNGEMHLDPDSFKDAQELLEKKYIGDALIKAQGKIRVACKMLGMSRNTFKKLMNKYELTNMDTD